MSKFIALFLFELRRIWTKGKIIFFSISIFLIWLVIYVVLKSGIIGAGGLIQVLSLSQLVSSELNYFIPLLTVFFSSAIFSEDIKNNYFRTILTRAISRQAYLTIRILVILCSMWTLVFLVSDLPLMIFPNILGIKIDFDLNMLFIIHGFYFLIAVTYLSITMFLSSRFSGFMNVLIFILWLFADSIFTPIISFIFWDNIFLIILSDFFFPSGFKNCMEHYLILKTVLPEEMMFGFSAMFGFLFLVYFSFSKINIDKGR